jgi:hypothetical protein
MKQRSISIQMFHCVINMRNTLATLLYFPVFAAFLSTQQHMQRVHSIQLNVPESAFNSPSHLIIRCSLRLYRRLPL